MKRTIKVKLNPTQKKKDEIVSTMNVYREVVNKFIDKFSRYKYLDKLNLNGYESYKQSIQEQNINLATGGESSLVS